METGGGGERADSQNLRSFLRIKEEDVRGNAPGVTFNSAITDKGGPGEVLRTQSNRTLLDIIREESGNKDGKKSWRHFKDKLRLRRTGSGSSWTSSVPIPASDIPINNNPNRNPPMNRRPGTGFGDSGESTQFNSSAGVGLQRNSSRARVSGRFEHTSSLAMRRLQRERDENESEEDEEDEHRSNGTEEDEDEEEEDGEEGVGDGEGGDGEQQPVRMSLMSLLAETDRQMGLDGSAFMMDDDDDEDDEDDEEEEESSGGGGFSTCCICMVRHKGSAFIPCGHTFCRMCSRELLVQRGHCLLCNNYILEILDIF